MTTELAIRIASQKGYDCFQYRHLVLSPKETRELHIDGEMYALTDHREELSGIKVFSTRGVYIRGIGINNEVQYEHEGYCTVDNLTKEVRNFFFIEAKRQKR